MRKLVYIPNAKIEVLVFGEKRIYTKNRFRSQKVRKSENEKRNGRTRIMAQYEVNIRRSERDQTRNGRHYARQKIRIF